MCRFNLISAKFTVADTARVFENFPSFSKLKIQLSRPWTTIQLEHCTNWFRHWLCGSVTQTALKFPNWSVRWTNLIARIAFYFANDQLLPFGRGTYKSPHFQSGASGSSATCPCFWLKCSCIFQAVIVTPRRQNSIVFDLNGHRHHWCC